MRPKIDPTSPFRSSTRRTPFLLRVASASLSLALLGGCTTSSSKGCFPDCGPDAYAIGTAGWCVPYAPDAEAHQDAGPGYGGYGGYGGDDGGPWRCTATSAEIGTLTTKVKRGACRASSVTSPAQCNTASDCPTVCCVAGEDGAFHPLAAEAELDAGDADASSHGDASDDAGGEVDADVDASTDAGTDAQPGPLDMVRASACYRCDRCLSPEETCALLGAGLDGGPP